LTRWTSSTSLKISHHQRYIRDAGHMFALSKLGDGCFVVEAFNHRSYGLALEVLADVMFTMGVHLDVNDPR